MMSKKRFFLSVIRFIVLLSLFASLFFALRYFYSKVTVKTYEAPLSPVETVKPVWGTLDKVLKVNGYAESSEKVTVVPYVDGTIIEYNIKEGDSVKEGDVIAVIDKEPYELQLKQAKAAVSGYTSSFEKVSALYEKKAISQQEYDTLKAQVEAAKAQEELAALQLSYCFVKAKTSGVVQKTLASKGAAASKGTPIAIIADPENLVVDLKINEKYYSLFKENQEELETTIIKPSNTFEEEYRAMSSISFISPYIDPSTKNFALQLETKAEGKLSSGMYVKGEIVYGKVSGYLIDRNVLKLDNSAYYVDEEGKAVYVDLSSSFMTDDYVVVPEALRDADFIIKGQNGILSGERVEVINEAE